MSSSSRHATAALHGFCLVVISSCWPALATTYVQVSDEHLASRADVVGLFEVLDAASAPTSLIATDYRVRVDTLIDGDVAGSVLVVRVPGGENANGEGLLFQGLPRFRPGDRVLLFLRPRRDGAWGIVHLLLGAFRAHVQEGRELLLRPHLDESRRLGPGGRLVQGSEAQARSLDLFVAWLHDRAQGRARAPDYFVEIPSSARTPVAGIEERFTLLRDQGTQIPLRWFDFDDGGRVRWFAHESGQSGIADGGFDEVERAVEVWNTVPRTSMRLVFAGQTKADGGFAAADGRNTVLFNDPNGEIDEAFNCEEGGVLAIGGPRYFLDVGRFRGREFFRISEGEVVTNRNLPCFLRSSGVRLEEIVAHEIGHTLGFGHSCGDDRSPDCSTNRVLDEALMRASVHADGRGASLNADDRAAARELYGTGSANTPRAPTGLALELLSGDAVRLSWSDRSGNEDGFRIYRRLGGGSFAAVAETGVGETVFVDADLDPTASYTWEVRAFNDAGESGASNRVSIALATVAPGRAVLRSTAFFGSEGDGEATIVIERVGGAAGELPVRVATAPLSATQDIDYEPKDVVVTWANGDQQPKFVTVPVFDDLSSEPTELAEVLLSSVPVGLGPAVLLETGVVAIGDDDGEPGCSPAARHLCLLESRFKVEVEWRNHRNGERGVGTAVPFAEETGFFWFFDSDNIELVTKALDGRPVTGAFWFFYGALSDVEYWITVTDTVTQARQLYRNAPENICGRGDTSAFPVGTEALPETRRRRATVGLLTAPSAQAWIDPLVSRQDCIGDESTLCLLDGRFEVAVDWRNHRNGQQGVGTAVPFSDETGFFWFFDSDNIELVTKALDGRPVNGDFWFFYGALSDVQYTIRVRDTVTDAVQTYGNEPGDICGQGDTSAFPGGA